MFKSHISLSFIIISIMHQRTMAFDPFTTVVATNSALGILGSANGIIEGGDLSAFTDLLGTASDTLEESGSLAADLGYEGDSSDLDEQIQRLEKLNAELGDIKWTKDELKYTLTSDINNTKNLSNKIRQMRKLISISKKLAGKFGLKTKGSDKVATLQQVKISSLILDEMQALRKLQLTTYLENKEIKAKQDIYLNRILKEETAKNQTMRRRP